MDDAGLPIQFDSYVPVDHEGLRANVRHALSLNLPELPDYSYPWATMLDIVANGPSARLPLPGGRTLAVNGALALWTREGRAPDMWIGCDPQPLLADMLRDAPLSTVYYVASKCHPSVFAALAGHSVVLYHIAEPATQDLTENYISVSSGCSVTTTAFGIMALLGFRRFHTYGWDGCYGEDGSDHAVPQNHVSDGDVWVDVEATGRRYHSTPSWAMECEDARVYLVGFPFSVTIHGGGMFGAILSDLLPHRISEAP